MHVPKSVHSACASVAGFQAFSLLCQRHPACKLYGVAQLLNLYAGSTALGLPRKRQDFKLIICNSTHDLQPFQSLLTQKLVCQHHFPYRSKRQTGLFFTQQGLFGCRVTGTAPSVPLLTWCHKRAFPSTTSCATCCKAQSAVQHLHLTQAWLGTSCASLRGLQARQISLPTVPAVTALSGHVKCSHSNLSSICLSLRPAFSCMQT